MCSYSLCYVRNNYCEQLPDVHMVNRNRKYWFVNATYSTWCYTVHTRVVHDFVHSDQWSLFTAVIVKQNRCTWVEELTDISKKNWITHTHIYICIYIWFVLMKAKKYEALYCVLFTSSLLPTLSHFHIIFCLRPFHQNI